MRASRQKIVEAIKALRGHNIAKMAETLPAAAKREAAPAPEPKDGLTIELVDDEDDEPTLH